MKIQVKVKALSLKINNKEVFSVQDGEFDGEITVEDFKEMINVELAKNKVPSPPIKPMPKPLFYKGTLIRISSGDFVIIKESEFCVTNTDTIKYDERVSGYVGKVLVINQAENSIKIKLGDGPGELAGSEIYVHPNWLEYKQF